MNEKIAINNVSKIKLLRGGFRAITGKIAKNYHKAYSVKTPVATLSIHGTDYSILAKIKQQKNRRKNQQFDVDNSVPLGKKPQHVVSRKFISVFSTEAKSISISAVDAPTTGISNTFRK